MHFNDLLVYWLQDEQKGKQELSSSQYTVGRRKMKSITAFALLSMLLFASARADGHTQAEKKPITVVVVYAELSAARGCQVLTIPAGTTLRKLLKEGRSFGATGFLMAVQGAVELRRLPNMTRKSITLSLPVRDARNSEKAEIPLEDGDIVITDVWPDF